MAIANNAYVYATGAMHIFCRVQTVGPNPFNLGGQGSGEAINYLGTCEFAPEFDDNKHWGQVFSAVGGSMVPYDMAYGSQIPTIGVDLVRHNDTILRKIEDAPNFGRVVKNGGINDGGPDGLEVVGDIGALVMSQGLGIEFWFLSTFYKYSQRNLFAYPDLRPGRYYRCCIPLRKFDDSAGRLPSRKIRLDLLSIGVYDPVTQGKFIFSSKVADFAALPDPG